MRSKYVVPALIVSSLTALLLAQPPGKAGKGGAPNSREAEALAEPYRGIGTKDGIEHGLFSIKSTGVSTDPVRKAADAFLAVLTPEQRRKTKFPVDDIEWRKWMNVHRYTRQGVSFQEMSDAQRDAAFGLLKASLSAKGLKLSQDIMKLNHTLGELNNNNFTEYGQWLYHITVMGEPSAKQPWGWQIDGHHLIINYFVLAIRSSCRRTSTVRSRWWPDPVSSRAFPSCKMSKTGDSPCCARWMPRSGSRRCSR